MVRIQLNCIALVIVLMCEFAIVSQAATNIRLNTFLEVLGAARNLESAVRLLTDKSPALIKARTDVLYAFAREPKSAHCHKQRQEVIRVVNEYKIKAYNFVDDSKKKQNWFSNWASKIAGPFGAMRNLAKFAKSLNAITDRYEEQAKGGLLTHNDVDCDMSKFIIRMYDAILFVLRTDIHTLVVEEPQIMNSAIYERLKSDKFVANNNFYEMHEITPRQRELLLELFASKVDVKQTTVEQALEHFDKPSSYIIGRLLDSCQEIPYYIDQWKRAEETRATVCARSTSDPQNSFFPREFKLDKYADISQFCVNFLESL